MLKKKFCNFRPILFIALAMIISIILAVFVFDMQIARFFIFLGLALVAIVIFIIFFLKKWNILIFLSALFLFMSLPFLTVNYQTYRLDENTKYETGEQMVLGKICDYYKITKNNYLQIIIDKVEISSGDIVEEIDGKIAIYTNPDYVDLTKLDIGRYVFAKLELNFNTISSKDQWELSNISKDIVAGGVTRYFNIKIYDETDKGLSEIVKSKVYETLKLTNMQNFDVAYAMMFGDSVLVDSDVKSIFQGTGIAHLLAVSGLHISAIVFALSFLLKKMKISQKVQLILFIIILSLYCYLCNFSISVIRASLMAILLNYSYIRGKAYDRLSVLSLVALFILLINPMQLFNISFVLSFLAVFSIILLADPIARIFKKIFYDKFARTLGVLFAIQIGLTAVNLFYFNTIQPLSFVANFVSIPIATFAFILIIIATICVICFPFLAPICKWIGEIFTLITQFNNYIKSLNLMVTLPDITPFVIPVLTVVMFLISDYTFIKKPIKVALSVCLFISYVGLFFI